MCITPLTLKDPKKGQTFPLPCGKCPQCVKKRTSQWGFRLQKEAEASSSALFITLTYKSECIKLSERGWPTLHPQDVTNFLKRLRKKSKRKIKYYYVGEYGKENQRPHYHMLIFNAEMEDIESTWNLGNVHYGQVEGGSVAYTLKYMYKEPTANLQLWKKRLPEFGRMSKGLGISYLTADSMYYHTQANYLLSRVCMKQNDLLISMPRYYRDRIYDHHHKVMIQIEAEKRAQEQYKQRYDDIHSGKIDLHTEIEYHKNQFRKMEKDKYKNKFV